MLAIILFTGTVCGVLVIKITDYLQYRKDMKSWVKSSILELDKDVDKLYKYISTIQKELATKEAGCHGNCGGNTCRSE